MVALVVCYRSISLLLLLLLLLSRSVVSDSVWPHRRQPTRLLHPWDFPGKSTGVGCHCLLHLIHYSFLNPSETITSEKYVQQIDEMHQKLQCLQQTLVSRKGPVLLQENAWWQIAQPMLQKLTKSGYQVLPQLQYSPDLAPTDYHFFKHPDNFFKENASTTTRIRTVFSNILLNPETWIFILQE